jgi:predicted amidohydrolase/NH3-dependent NAD+ synthetase
MTGTRSRLTVGVAQIDVRLGDLAGNEKRHIDWIGKAKAAGVELLVFPELSLTGYRLLHLTPRVALTRSSPVLARLAEAAAGMAVLVGFVEEDERGVLRNSAALLAGGSVAQIHRKIYLPTYGIFQEGRFFAAGRELALAPLPAGPAGVLICEDLWHPELARRLAGAGAKLIVVVSAAPGRIGPGPTPVSQDSWELLTRGTALVNTSWVVYCNRVGWEEGAFYPGGSHVVRPSGEVAARAPFLDEQLLVTEVDLRDADRLRWRLPLLEDERHDVAGPAEWNGQAAEDRTGGRGGAARHLRLASPSAVPGEETPNLDPQPAEETAGDAGLVPDLDLDLPLAETILTHFIRDAVETAGASGVVVGLSGGIDSSLATALAVRALGPERVHGFLLPYRTSSPESEADARLVAESLGLPHRLIDISPMVDAYFAEEPGADPGRRGNKMARERMTILADLFPGQSDEGDLGFSYDVADRVLALLFDTGLTPDEVIALGYPKAAVERIVALERTNRFKRRLMLIARLLGSAINLDQEIPRD